MKRTSPSWTSSSENRPCLVKNHNSIPMKKNVFQNSKGLQRWLGWTSSPALAASADFALESASSPSLRSSTGSPSGFARRSDPLPSWNYICQYLQCILVSFIIVSVFQCTIPAIKQRMPDLLHFAAAFQQSVWDLFQIQCWSEMLCFLFSVSFIRKRLAWSLH